MVNTRTLIVSALAFTAISSFAAPIGNVQEQSLERRIVLGKLPQNDGDARQYAAREDGLDTFEYDARDFDELEYDARDYDGLDLLEYDARDFDGLDAFEYDARDLDDGFEYDARDFEEPFERDFAVPEDEELERRFSFSKLWNSKGANIAKNIASTALSFLH